LSAGVSVEAFEEMTDFASVRFVDPDGYLVEVYWEP
jgi:hypothetical protein